jgi:subtilisin family serine protease
VKLNVLVLTATAVALSACSDDPVQPTVARMPTVNAAVQAAGANRSIVEFNGQVRKDFRQTVATLGGSVDFISEGAGFASVSGLSADAAATLRRSNGIGAVYDDVIVQLARGEPGGTIPDDAAAMSPTNPAAAVLFNSLQWNMRAINAPAAWAAGNLGSPNVTAAILDSGIDYDNLDMNGLVDLSRSTSFVPSDDAIVTALFPTRNKVDDLGGHGTLVASQVSSNAIAFAGVGSRTRLMGIKVLGFTGSGSLGGILAGLIWAADHGADVANMSIGITGTSIDKPGNGQFVALVNRVFNYANRAGMVVVVASGNEAVDLDGDGRGFAVFCEAPHVICVSATGPTSGTPFAGPWANVDAPADYSNIGKQDVAVAAPGGTNFGFVSALCARHLIQVVGGAPTLPCVSGTFVFGGTGTSASAPHVTGLVAQLIAKYGKGTPSQIKQLLLNGVDDLGAPGKDPFYGYGRINVAKALSQ